MHKHTNTYLFTFTFKHKMLAQTGCHLNPFKGCKQEKINCPKAQTPFRYKLPQDISVQCRRQQLFRLPYFKHVPCHQTHTCTCQNKTFPVSCLLPDSIQKGFHRCAHPKQTSVYSHGQTLPLSVCPCQLTSVQKYR